MTRGCLHFCTKELVFPADSEIGIIKRQIGSLSSLETAQSLQEVFCSAAAVPLHFPGISSCGIGEAANRRWQGLASQRAHRADRETRALSVATPVSAYICRKILEIKRN